MSPILLAILIAFAKPAAVHELVGEVVSISDGDTMTVLDAEKVQHKIRLKGVVSPETDQTFPTAARRSLGTRVHHERVRVTRRQKDGYVKISRRGPPARQPHQPQVICGRACVVVSEVFPIAWELEKAESEARRE
jgi:hypothetical protein